MRAFSVLLRSAAPVALVLTIALAPGRSARAGDDPAPAPVEPASPTPVEPAPPAPVEPATPTPVEPETPSPGEPAPAAPVESATPPTPPTGPATPPRTFAKPAEAVLAWISAFETNDNAALAALLGSEGADLVPDGKDVRVAEERRRLARLARTSWAFDRTKEADGILRVEVGVERLPLAIPVARVDGTWRFDAAAGRAELLARRVGRNELEAIGLCRQYLEMQVEYAAEDRDADGVREYAQRVASTPGTQDGLYWETPGGENMEPSPLGIALATIGDQGADAVPHGGYRWSILKAQGAHAPGGAYGYVLNGNMIAGFALVAAPAEYRLTGVMTFLVSNHGKVFQKDLGATTGTVVAAMDAFDPDDTWTEVVDADVAALEASRGGSDDTVPVGPNCVRPPAPTSVEARPAGTQPGAPTVGRPAETPVATPAGTEPRPSEPRTAKAAADPLGTFEVTYEDGTRVTMTVPDLTSVTWLAAEGATGTETDDRREIAPNVWYVSWQQSDGTVVTQVVDLAKMTVLSTRAADGKRVVLEGRIVRQP